MSLVLVTGGSGYFGTRPSRSWDGAPAPPRRPCLTPRRACATSASSIIDDRRRQPSPADGRRIDRPVPGRRRVPEEPRSAGRRSRQPESRRLLRASHRGCRFRAVYPVDSQHRVRARREVTASLVQRRLKLLDHVALGPFTERRRLGAITAQCSPGNRPDDPIHGEVVALLKLLHGLLGHRTEDAIDLVIAESSADEQVLGRADSWSSVAFRDGRGSGDCSAPILRWSPVQLGERAQLGPAPGVA